MEWFRWVITITILLLRKWIVSDFDGFQSIQSFDFECFHWCKTIIADFDRFNFSKSREIKYCVISIITRVICQYNRSNRWTKRLNIDWWKWCILQEMSTNVCKWYNTDKTKLENVFDFTFLNGLPGRSAFWRFGISNNYQYSLRFQTLKNQYLNTFEISWSKIDGC